MRVGVVSPNILSNVRDYNAMNENPDIPWPFDSLAKRSSLLFDKLYISDNIDLTYEIIGGPSLFGNDHNGNTLEYLTRQGLILTPQDLGYSSGEAFLSENIKGKTADLHRRLLAVGNPSNNCGEGDYTYVGQPDIGEFEAHDGNHPRSEAGWDDPQIKVMERLYEGLLLQRNVAILREAGIEDIAIVGRLYGEKSISPDTHPVWEIILHEMPSLDIRAPWEDVLGFRAEQRTQHLIRSLRRWIRKVVAESWTSAELEDEVRELVYEYEKHIRTAGMAHGIGTLTCVITGTTELVEDIVKLRLGRIAQLVTAGMDRSVKFREAELQAPGRELALFPEVRKRF